MLVHPNCSLRSADTSAQIYVASIAIGTGESIIVQIMLRGCASVPLVLFPWLLSPCRSNAFSSPLYISNIRIYHSFGLFPFSHA